MNDEDLAIADMDNDNASGGSSSRGTMVIRVWTEAGHEAPFRARLTFAKADGEDATNVLAGDPEQVVDAVRDWLAQVAG